MDGGDSVVAKMQLIDKVEKDLATPIQEEEQVDDLRIQI